MESNGFNNTVKQRNTRMLKRSCNHIAQTPSKPKHGVSYNATPFQTFAKRPISTVSKKTAAPPLKKKVNPLRKAVIGSYRNNTEVHGALKTSSEHTPIPKTLIRHKDSQLGYKNALGDSMIRPQKSSYENSIPEHAPIPVAPITMHTGPHRRSIGLNSSLQKIRLKPEAQGVPKILSRQLHLPRTTDLTCCHDELSCTGLHNQTPLELHKEDEPIPQSLHLHLKSNLNTIEPSSRCSQISEANSFQDASSSLKVRDREPVQVSELGKTLDPSLTIHSKEGYMHKNKENKSYNCTQRPTPFTPNSSKFLHQPNLHQLAKSFSYQLATNMEQLHYSMNKITAHGEYPIKCDVKPSSVSSPLNPNRYPHKAFRPTKPTPLSVYALSSPQKISPTIHIHSKAEKRVYNRLKRHLEYDDENPHIAAITPQRKKQLVQEKQYCGLEIAEAKDKAEEDAAKFLCVARPVKPTLVKAAPTTKSEVSAEFESPPLVPDSLDSAPPSTPNSCLDFTLDSNMEQLSTFESHSNSPVHYHKVLKQIPDRQILQNFDIGSFLILKGGGPLCTVVKPFLQDNVLAFIPRDWSPDIQAKVYCSSMSNYMLYLQSRTRLIPKGAWYSSLLGTNTLLSTLHEQSNWNVFSIFGSAPKSVVLHDIFDYSTYAFWCTADARKHNATLRKVYETNEVLTPEDTIPKSEWEKIEAMLKKKWDEESKLELDWSMDPLRIDEALWYVDYCKLTVDKGDEIAETEVCFCPTPNPFSQFGWTDIRSSNFQSYRGRRASGSAANYHTKVTPHPASPNLSMTRLHKHKPLYLTKTHPFPSLIGVKASSPMHQR